MLVDTTEQMSLRATTKGTSPAKNRTQIKLHQYYYYYYYY